MVGTLLINWCVWTRYKMEHVCCNPQGSAPSFSARLQTLSGAVFRFARRNIK